MRRPTLIALFIVALAFGAALDRVWIAGSPWLSQRVYVATIHGKKGGGCGGPAGYSYSRFGRRLGNDDGFFQVACEELFHPSEDVALFCHCD